MTAIKEIGINERFEVQFIEITRAEGPHNLCDITKAFRTFDDANEWLLEQSETFPKGGGYDKHDFKVVYSNGVEYKGRLDCQHPSEIDSDLDVAKHMRDFLFWYAGMTDNPWCGIAKYNAMIDEYESDGSKQWAIDFLDNYYI